jgi:hypothetical protein
VVVIPKSDPTNKSSYNIGEEFSGKADGSRHPSTDGGTQIAV